MRCWQTLPILNNPLHTRECHEICSETVPCAVIPRLVSAGGKLECLDSSDLHEMTHHEHVVRRAFGAPQFGNVISKSTCDIRFTDKVPLFGIAVTSVAQGR